MNSNQPLLQPTVLLYIGHDTPPPVDGQWATAITLTGLIDRTVTLQPALIVLDLPDGAWQPFASALKSSNATRRIPVLLIGDENADVALHGADAVVARAAWQAAPANVVAEYARHDDEDVRAALTEQCAEPLPPRGVAAIERFNSGQYYDQHDLFEAQWMEDARPVRSLYQAVLQVGVGYYQVTRGNYRGALKTLQKSVQWLNLLPDVCQGVNIGQLRADSLAVRAELERLGSDRMAEFDRRLLKPVEIVS